MAATYKDATNYEIGKLVWRFYHPAAARKLELDCIGSYLIVVKLSDICNSIQRTPKSPVINVHIDHIKP